MSTQPRPARLAKSFLLAALLLLALGGHSYAANLRLMEADEPDGTLPLIASAGGGFSIRSPFRNSTGGDDWRSINGMYNEPRSSTNMHEGTDIQATTGTPIYPVHGRSEAEPTDDAWVLTKGTNSGYGNFIIIRHKDNVSGTNYQFDTLYAHMDQPSGLSPGAPVSVTDPIGLAGCTGSCTGPHLHLEFRALNAKAADGTTPRKYAPAAFYWAKNNAWALDTSFITRLPDSANCVRFRTRSKHSDGYYSAREARIWYSTSAGGPWSSALMSAEDSPATIHRYCFTQTGVRMYFYVGVVDG